MYEFDVERLFNRQAPAVLPDIARESRALGFDRQSEIRVGHLVRFLAATKPAGRFLEIGTGTGFGSAWLLDGMDQSSTLTSIEARLECSSIAQKYLGSDPRATFLVGDGDEFLMNAQAASYDLIFADAPPGKRDYPQRAFRLLKPGGIYVGDDMMPQDDWFPEYYPEAERMVNGLAAVPGMRTVGLDWSTGVVLMTKDPR
jgi:predicted O-methyltransferase YrrM